MVCRSLPEKRKIIKGVKYILLDISNKNNLQKLSEISFNYSKSQDYRSLLFLNQVRNNDIHFISLVNIVFHIRKDNLLDLCKLEYGR